MRQYRRVAYEDRCQISALLQADFTIPEISIKLGLHRSTVYRELARNRQGDAYAAQSAQSAAERAYRRCRRKKLLTDSLKELILVYANFGWSPQQISCRMKKEVNQFVSYQTIYRGFSRLTLSGKIIRQRRRRKSGGRYSLRAKQKQRRNLIQNRPFIVERRGRIGDWERDGMYGANRKQLLVLTDRKSRYTKIEKMSASDSRTVNEITKSTLAGLGKRVFTITNDNGPEFGTTASLNWKVFHCTPHKPQQRGTVENTIGLLRQYIKRNTDLALLSKESLIDIENRINFRPRRCLNYETPFEAFFKTKVALAMEN